MPGANKKSEYQPVYVIEIFLDSGPLVFSTRDVEIIPRQDSGFGEGGFQEGGFGGLGGLES